MTGPYDPSPTTPPVAGQDYWLVDGYRGRLREAPRPAEKVSSWTMISEEMAQDTAGIRAVDEYLRSDGKTRRAGWGLRTWTSSEGHVLTFERPWRKVLARAVRLVVR